tara:strand:- start:614 stop:1045 length:432 start_codon:yes stop_codon:yes gene_type:complete
MIKREIEILQFEGGVFPRYRKLDRQHSDKYLVNRLGRMGYFGPIAGQYVGRKHIAYVDSSTEGKMFVKHLKQYFNSINVKVLKRQPHSQTVEDFQRTKELLHEAIAKSSADIDDLADQLQELWNELSDVFSDAELAERGLTRS